jgi:hypothetical protein
LGLKGTAGVVHSEELDMARRHVAEGAARVAKQRQLVENLEADGYPTELAHQLLTSLEDTLEQMRRHLAYLAADG